LKLTVLVLLLTDILLHVRDTVLALFRKGGLASAGQNFIRNSISCGLKFSYAIRLITAA